MAECGHRASSYVEIEDREYAICQECLWISNGFIGRLNES